MNLDDMACTGMIDDILISSTIGRNKHLIPGEVIEEINFGRIEVGQADKRTYSLVNKTGGFVEELDMNIEGTGLKILEKPETIERNGEENFIVQAKPPLDYKKPLRGTITLEAKVVYGP